MKQLTLQAKKENLNQVLAFIDEELKAADCPMKLVMKFDVCVEEIFVNVASYAYARKPEPGEVTIDMEITGDPAVAKVTFTDSGIPYNPLEKEDPDVTLSAEERQIGGLGIYIVKKSMDDVLYEYKDGCNFFTMIKTLV